MIAPDLLAQLRCPTCREPLKSKGGRGHCRSCAISYPMLGDIPLVVSQPDLVWREWQQKVYHQLATYQREIAEIDSAMSTIAERAVDGVGGRPSTVVSKAGAAVKRWQLLKRGLLVNATSLNTLMKPLLAQSWGTEKLTRAVQTELPLQPSLMGYYANLHRDWAWGQSEIKAQTEALQGLWPHLGAGAEVLVLGSGAGGLSFALATQFEQLKFFNLDLNPLLLLVHHNLMAGEEIDWTEFPISPIELDKTAVIQSLRASQTLRKSQQHLIWGDALQPPFRDESFDLVITPWVIDILPQDLSRTADLVARLLKKDGIWLNMGPYGFHQSPWLDRYSGQEVLQMVESRGFKDIQSRRTEVPYLNSPNSCQKRFEQMLMFSGQRPSELPDIKSLPLWPPWLENPDLPVPLDSKIQSYQVATQTQAQIFSAVDGRRSLRDISAKWGDSQGFQREEALAAVETLFRQLFTRSN